MRVFFAPLVAAGFAFGLVTAATELIPPSPPATGIVWANRVFSTPSDLALWLKARGASYATWAANHPPTARALERAGTKLAAPPSRRSPSEQRTAVGRRPSGERRHAGLAIALVIVSLLGLLALVVTLRTRRPQVAPARRMRARAAPARRPTLGSDLLQTALHRGSVARLAVSSVAALRLRNRGPAKPARPRPAIVLPRRRAADDLGAGGYEYALARDALRRSVPEIALYLTSALLACAVGVSLALYLN